MIKSRNCSKLKFYEKINKHATKLGNKTYSSNELEEKKPFSLFLNAAFPFRGLFM